MKLGIIGFGKIGQCIAKGLLESKLVEPSSLFASRKNSQPEPWLYPIKSTSSVDLLKSCHTVILAIKPQNMPEIARELSPFLTPKHLVISLLAGVTLPDLDIAFKHVPRLIRAMPNTPVWAGEGITAISAGSTATEEDLDLVKKVFDCVGKTIILDETYLDAVTGLSGCGPAFVYLLLEAMIDGGIRVGLSRENSTLLASQTFLGAAKMVLESKKHPAYLKDEVTTPAGCTIEGLMELEASKVRIALIKAVVKSTKKARKLSKKKKT